MVVYREEIDGLRGVAVISVILYHCGFNKYFSGGYVGVDIFFVISGYLITSIIENEYKQEKFSIKNFYERRCRRIIPALFFMLFLSNIFAYYIMLPQQLKEYGETLISVLFINSNIYFWWKDDGYFSQLSELNPLVHTWSLSVEEQFYLIYPSLFYLFYKKKKFFLILLIVIALISLFLSQWGENFQSISTTQFQMFAQHRYATFYLPLGRIWELLLGAFIAFYLPKKQSTNRLLLEYQTHRKLSNIFDQLFSSIGFLMIIISIVFFDRNKIPPFPNIYTLIPNCEAALIIIYGHKNTFVGYLLSRRLLRWIGLISYSLYLSHQPLLAYVRLYSNELSQSSIITIIIIMFPLSIFSYVFIEQPFRNKKSVSQKCLFIIVGISILILFLSALFFIKTADNRSLLTEEGSDSYLADLREYGNDDYVIRRFSHLAKTKKTFSNETRLLNKRIVLIGDSFAKDFYNMIIEGKRLIHFDICVYPIAFDCQIYLGDEDRNKFLSSAFKQFCNNNGHDIKLVLPLIRQANIIILASNFQSWSAKRLPNTIKLLNITKQQQIFVIGPKSFGKVYPKLYINKTKQYRIQQYQYPHKSSITINQLFEKTLDKSIFINIQKMICTGLNQKCPLFTPNGKLISYDGLHLTKYGAHYLSEIIFNNEPLNKLK